MLFHSNKKQEMVSSQRLSFEIDTPISAPPVKSFTTGTSCTIVTAHGTNFYNVGDHRLSRHEHELLSLAKSSVIEALASLDVPISMSLFEQARAIANARLAQSADQPTASYLSYLVAHDTVGFGPISLLMENRSNMEEIEISSPSEPISVYLSDFGRCKTNLSFRDEQSFRQYINKFIYESEKELGENMPIIDAQVGEARIHAQIRPYAVNGGAASIRLGRGKQMGAYALLRSSTLSPEILAYLWTALDSSMNFVISGAPGSGKTTLVHALAQFVPWHSKLVTIEDDVNELKLDGPSMNTVALYGSKFSGISAKAQVINALRMRPDRIVIGEIRGEEASELFSGANLGTPFMTTMHSSEEPLGVIKKLLVKPMRVEPGSLSMLDFSVYMKQQDLKNRTVNGISEYKWLSRAETEEGTVVGDYDLVKHSCIVEDSKLASGFMEVSKVIAANARITGLSEAAAKKEFESRVSIIKKALSSSKNEDEFRQNIWKAWYS